MAEEKNAWERSYGIRLFSALLGSTIVMALIRSLVSLNLWLGILIAVLVYSATYAIVTRRWLRSHPRPRD